MSPEPVSSARYLEIWSLAAARLLHSCRLHQPLMLDSWSLEVASAKTAKEARALLLLPTERMGGALSSSQAAGQQRPMSQRRTRAVPSSPAAKDSQICRDRALRCWKTNRTRAAQMAEAELASLGVEARTLLEQFLDLRNGLPPSKFHLVCPGRDAVSQQSHEVEMKLALAEVTPTEFEVPVDC